MSYFLLGDLHGVRQPGLGRQALRFKGADFVRVA
jgi:hypothetical protein